MYSVEYHLKTTFSLGYEIAFRYLKKIRSLALYDHYDKIFCYYLILFPGTIDYDYFLLF